MLHDSNSRIGHNCWLLYRVFVSCVLVSYNCYALGKTKALQTAMIVTLALLAASSAVDMLSISITNCCLSFSILRIISNSAIIIIIVRRATKILVVKRVAQFVIAYTFNT